MCLQYLAVDVVDKLRLFSAFISEQPQSLLRAQIEREVEGIDDDPREDLHATRCTFMVILAASASR